LREQNDTDRGERPTSRMDFQTCFLHDGGEYTVRVFMTLFLLLLEAGVALLLLLGIVWWTWPRKPKEPPRDPPPEH
jgi:hypothetical protein